MNKKNIVVIEVVSDLTAEELESGHIEETALQLEANIPGSSVRVVSVTEK